jgi:hypothetical protein
VNCKKLPNTVIRIIKIERHNVSPIVNKLLRKEIFPFIPEKPITPRTNVSNVIYKIIVNGCVLNSSVVTEIRFFENNAVINKATQINDKTKDNKFKFFFNRTFPLW